MKLTQAKELHLAPWDLAVILANAGVISPNPCAVDLRIVDRTEVNKGLTVIISWQEMEQEMPRPDLNKERVDG